MNIPFCLEPLHFSRHGCLRNNTKRNKRKSKANLDLELAFGHIVCAIRADLVVRIRGRPAADPPLDHFPSQSRT